MHTNENNPNENNPHLNSGPRRQKLLTEWEEEQIRIDALYAKHLRKIERLHPQLSSTEHRVCAGIMLRKRSWQVGQLLGIEEGTVNNHRSHIRGKLGLATNAALSSYLLSLLDDEQQS